jgi:hypothetical protein
MGPSPAPRVMSFAPARWARQMWHPAAVRQGEPPARVGRLRMVARYRRMNGWPRSCIRRAKQSVRAQLRVPARLPVLPGHQNPHSTCSASTLPVLEVRCPESILQSITCRGYAGVWDAARAPPPGPWRPLEGRRRAAIRPSRRSCLAAGSTRDTGAPRRSAPEGRFWTRRGANDPPQGHAGSVHDCERTARACSR